MDTVAQLTSLPDARGILGDFTERLARTREMIGLANRKKTELEILERVYENAVRDLQAVAANEYEESEPPFEPDIQEQATPPSQEDIPEEMEDLPDTVEDLPVADTEPVSASEDLWPDFPEDNWN